MFKKQPIIIVLSICLIVHFSSTIGMTSDEKFKVSLIVSSDKYKDKITSYVMRELRSLGDVDIVKEDEDYSIAVIAFPLFDQGSDNVRGIALSFIIVGKVDVPDFVNDSSETEENLISSWLGLFESQMYYYPSFSLRTGPPDSLKEFCEEIVVELDTKNLEPLREVNRGFDKYMKDSESK